VVPGPLAEALVHQLNRAEAEPVVLRLRTAGGLSSQHAADRLQSWAQYHQYPIIRLRVSTAAPTAFGPIRELLRRLLPNVQRESAGLLAEFAPELTMLLPELRARPQYAQTAALSKIAVGGAKRRLHRDSERLFRLVSAVASIGGHGLTSLTTTYGRPPVVLIENADLCDRYSLACLLRIWQVSTGPGPVIVLATSPSGPDRPQWAARPQRAARGLDDAVLAGWTDAEGEQDQLIRRFLAATGAVDLPGERPSTPVDQLELVPELSSLPGVVSERLIAAAVLGDPVLAAAIDGPLDGPLAALARVPGARRAVLRQLTAEQYRESCRALADKLRTTQTCLPQNGPDLEREGVEAALAFLEVAGGDNAAGASRALRLVQQSYGFTLNYELMLLCCRIALAAGESAAERLPALLLTGLTHAHLGHHDTAAEIFEAAYAAASTPEVRAQICYYQGVVAGRQLERSYLGQDWFERGLQHVAGRTGASARLESGWLRNGLALLAWRREQLAEAAELVRTALADTAGATETEEPPEPEPAGAAGPARPDAVQLANLRVNLVNTLSMVLEDQGDCAGALEAWRSLEPLGGAFSGGSFTKSYLYRESWLLLQSGEIKAAYACAISAMEVARQARDVFHAHIISHACTYLACRLGDFESAREWAHQTLELSLNLQDRHGEAHAAGQLAHVNYQAGDQASARRWMGRAVATAGDGPPAKAFRSALACMSDTRGPISRGPISRGLVSLGPDDELYGIALDRPKPKLSTPFPLTELVSSDSDVSLVHDRPLSANRAPRSER